MDYLRDELSLNEAMYLGIHAPLLVIFSVSSEKYTGLSVLVRIVLVKGSQ